MNEEILRNIWEYLSSEGKTDSDFQSWVNNVASDVGVQQNVHNYLTENNRTNSSFAQWQSNAFASGKTQGVAAPGAATTSESTGLASVDTSLGQPSADASKQIVDEDKLPEDKGWFEDMATAISGGWGAGKSVGEAFDVYRQGRNISDADLENFIVAANAIHEGGETNEAASWRRDTEKHGGGFLGGMMSLLENPGYAPQFIASSFATMVGSLVDSEEVAATTTAGAAAGAAAGSGISAAAASIGGPVGTVLGYFGGGLAGGIGGGMAGLIGAMETGLTLTDLLRDELGEREFNEVNIRALLNDRDVMERVKSRSLARGITIGAVEGLTMGLSRGVGGKILTSATTKGAVGLTKEGLKTGAKVAAATTGIEMVGGGTGEALGMLAAGQPLKGEEIFLEAIGEGKGIVNTSDIVKRAISKTKYELNGEEVTAEKIREVIESPNTSKADLAKMNIKVTGDKQFDNYVKGKQNDAIVDSQIDAKITDQKDRDRLVELERERQKAQSDTKKEGAYKVPDAEQKLADIEKQISDIINKYEGAVGFGKSKVAKDVTKARIDIKVADSIAFAEAAGKKIGKDVHVADDNASAQDIFNKIIEEHNAKPENKDNQIKWEDVADADGFIVGDAIVINKEIAGQTGAISVGSHEILHGILAKHLKSLELDITDADGNVIGKDKTKVKLSLIHISETTRQY